MHPQDNCVVDRFSLSLLSALLSALLSCAGATQPSSVLLLLAILNTSICMICVFVDAAVDVDSSHLHSPFLCFVANHAVDGSLFRAQQK